VRLTRWGLPAVVAMAAVTAGVLYWVDPYRASIDPNNAALKWWGLAALVLPVVARVLVTRLAARDPGATVVTASGQGMLAACGATAAAALILAFLTSVTIALFPHRVPLSQDPAEWARSLVLPVITLAVPALAVVAKQTRDAMRDVLERPFIRTLRASGVSRRSIVYKHALRSAAIPVATVVGIVFVGILSGTVVVESVFAIPGLGGLAVQATSQHDVPLILGAVVYFTVIVIVMNVLVDLAYGWLDPRVRVS